MKRLVLIDGHAVLHRAFHALPPLTSPSGEQVNAVYGFVSMLLKVVDDLKPDFICIAFDLPVPTFRHATYVAYQATRPHMDDGLKSQIGLVKEVVDAAGISIYASSGFEADDVIGTLAGKALQNKGQTINNMGKIGEVVIVTGDRDILQLVDNKVKVYMLMRGMTDARVFDKEAVEEYLGILPEQIVDYKALVGDSSDNYPGVPGVGPKTAVELIKEFGNLERIYKAVNRKKVKSEKISERVIEKLKLGYDSAILSQKLAKISTNAPIELDLDKAAFKDLKTNGKFHNKLGEFGFRSLIVRVKGEQKMISKKVKSKKDDGGQKRLF